MWVGRRSRTIGWHMGPTPRATLDESPQAAREVRRAVARCKRGDRDALRLLYVRYAGNVYGYIRSIVKDDKEAEDLTQHVFLKLITAIGKYDDRGIPFSGWLLRLARNVALDHLRRRRPIPAEEVFGADRSADEGALHRAGSLRAALVTLPDEQRTVVVMRHLVGLTPRGDRRRGWGARRAPSTACTTAAGARCSRSCAAWTPRRPPPRPPSSAAYGESRSAWRPRVRRPFDRAVHAARPRRSRAARPAARGRQRRGREGAFTLGEHVAAFERDFAAYCETAFAVGVSSGTEALALSLRALEIGPGDEVIVPANSFIATAEAVSAVGATPRLVDVCPRSHLLTAEILEPALGPRVRCVIPVHLYGATVDLDPILALARAAGVHVVEDACQAHGARYRGRRVGTLGALGCFSFYPTKNLGGVGRRRRRRHRFAELAERLELLRSHGERPRYRHRVDRHHRAPGCAAGGGPAAQAHPPGGLERRAPAARRALRELLRRQRSERRPARWQVSHGEASATESRRCPSPRPTTCTTCSWCARRA